MSEVRGPGSPDDPGVAGGSQPGDRPLERLVERDVPLARFTTLGSGGPASRFAAPRSLGELRTALAFASSDQLPVAVVGLGSNLLVADAGVDALVLHLEGELAQVTVHGQTIHAGGGASLAVCLHRARAAGLGGLEFACAIPGSAGGAVRMNAGAWGGEIAQVLRRALVVWHDGSTQHEQWLDGQGLGLAYRRSALAPGQVVALVELELAERPTEEIRAHVRELNRTRKAAQPTDRRTFGSVFKNPEHELTAGRMLDACGLRGFAIGGARISPKHANFIENAGGATTADALALIGEARRRALERFGVVLEPEVQLLGSIAVPALEP